ncbi:prepilin-type N-terminal cleavage/methylation domain-containing protein [Liberiplasma polymorphum]|uniref:prepilin-type N-terminal cleavage/methylation domain-containing protein n=1 Tax=Liberiplasma polymorphum TaxID=3374570 RepID=UPI003772D460
MIKNNKGVTLVELLIVIVILGIIAAISIPAVGGIVTNAQKDAVIADAVSIRNAANLYCTSANATERAQYCAASSTENDNLTETQLSEFISGLAANVTYVVNYYDGVYLVAVVTPSYTFIGNPSTATRGMVLDQPDTLFTIAEADFTLEPPAFVPAG